MTSNPDLFPALIPWSWLPGESLFSLCSRHHRLSGNRRASTTCKQLFGHPRMGLAHDLPSRVDDFVARTLGQVGSAEQIIDDHTILPYFLPFASEHVRNQARERLRGPGIGGLKFQLGVLTSRFRAHHPLKLCASCVSEDRHLHRVAYWHVEHQLPGVWVCPHHLQPLIASDLKSTGVLRFQWLLPDNAIAEHSETPRLQDLERHLVLARAAAALWRQPVGTAFRPAQLMRTYRDRLRARDLLGGSGPGRLRLKAIGAQYANYVASFRDVEELGALPGEATAAAADIARLAYRHRHGTHPIRHLCAICWLFGDFDEFLRAYQAAEPSHPEPTTPRAPTHRAWPERDALRDRARHLFAAGKSATAVAREIGVAVSTAMAWAAADSHATQSRPHLLVGNVRANVLGALRQGASKREAAAIGSVSVESVTRLLRTEIGLRSDWHAACDRNSRDVARGRWRSNLAAHPLLGVKALRRLEPAAYAWLYRNDRSWLVDVNARCCKETRQARTTLDWAGRDRALAQSIHSAALQLRVSKPGVRVTRQRLCQNVPQLQAKLAKLRQLPRSRTAIAEATSDGLPTGAHHQRKS